MKIYLFLILLFTLTACGPNVNYIKRVQLLEENVSQPTTEEEIIDAIQKYENRVEDIMAAENQTGIWYKILGVRYMDNRMYGEALKAFQNSIQYHPDNQNLYYYVGVCAGYMANAELDYTISGSSQKRDNYIALAESAYIRAIELEPNYDRALYGLGVLYVYEMDQSAQAISYLERLLTIDTGHSDAMFVLARAYYTNFDFEAASDMYDRIINTTQDKTKLRNAEENKKLALDALYDL